MAFNKKRIVAAVVGVAAVGLLAGFGGKAAAYGRHHGMNPEKAYKFLTFKVDSALDDIKATPEQRAQINQVKDELFKEGGQLRADHDAVRALVMEQWDSPTVDAAKIHRTLDERIDAFRAMAHKAADGAIKVHDVLTPEQRAALKAKLPERGERGERGDREP